jgi:hypothetical protein
VPIRAIICSYYRRARRAYGALRTRLRCARVSVGLITVLVLALGEPLLCILHCQIWLPIAYHSYFAAQHAHMHHTTSHAMISAETVAARGTAFVASPLPDGDPSCFMLRAAGNHDGTPFHVPPSPVHDLLPTVVVLIMLVLLTGARSAAPPGDPPHMAYSPRLRPPIPFAA